MVSISARSGIILGLFALAFFELGIMLCDKEMATLDIFKMVTQATFISGIVLVVNFFFGSSSGSAAKDVTISKQLDKQP